jgi:hypothetical protein
VIFAILDLIESMFEMGVCFIYNTERLTYMLLLLHMSCSNILVNLFAGHFPKP